MTWEEYTDLLASRALQIPIGLAKNEKKKLNEK